jgi:probable phosphoglycerate mutase
LQGHLDVPLSGLGQEQAEMVGWALKDVSFDAVYSSDLSRARQTAEAIMKHHTCRLVLDRRLREVHVGVFQGHTDREAQRLYPEERRLLRKDPVNYRRPGGESFQDLCDRVSRALADITEWHTKDDADKTAAIISHGGAINALFRALGHPIAGVVGNCSISVFRFEAGKWEIVRINDVTHLKDLASDLVERVP